MPGGKSYRLSVLDVSPVASGSTSTDALRNTLDLAQLADKLGFTRYWLAEHHNTPLIASSAPEIMIGHVANVHEKHSRRLRRHDAAESHATEGRRNVSRSRGAASRPRRSRPRPRARH